MNETNFALFMLGCSHQMDVCRPVDVPLVQYESEAACDEAMGHMMRIDVGYPVTVGKCLTADEAALERDMVFAWQFERNGELTVELKPYDGQTGGAEFEVAAAAE